MVKGFDRGVRFYTMLSVDIGFPETQVCCEFCPLLETHIRKQCRKTGEYIGDARKVGYYCPLKEKEDLENGI